MSNDLHGAKQVSSGSNLLIWWQTLTDDEQDLLRVTHTAIPDNQHLMAFLAWTECPLVTPGVDHATGYRLDRPDRLQALLAQM